MKTDLNIYLTITNYVQQGSWEGGISASKGPHTPSFPATNSSQIW